MTKRSIQSVFGAKVRRLRIERGLSQEKLAEEAGFHRTYVGMIERGERNISLRNIEILAKTLKVDLAKLFDNI